MNKGSVRPYGGEHEHQTSGICTVRDTVANIVSI